MYPIKVCFCENFTCFTEEEKEDWKNGNDIFGWIMYYSVIKLLTFSMSDLKLGQGAADLK